MEIVWSESTLLRIEQIGNFIAKDSAFHAITFVDKLIESVEHLKEFPMSGGLVVENPAFRQVVLQGYRIIYRLKEKSIEIVTVISPGLNQEL